VPEMHFVVRWPDETVETCYSPSLVVREHLAVGDSYTVTDFVHRARIALTIASDRVREKHGFPCSLALGQLATIEARARSFKEDAAARVLIESFHPT
jgi:uncharacterized repeat protein (TIGR04042 family)